MKSGRMKDRITIQKRVSGTDDVGGVVDSWVDVITVWSNVEASTTTHEEFASGSGFTAHVPYKITLRYSRFLDIRSNMRVMFKNRELLVQTVSEPKGTRNELIVLLCIERNEGQS